MAKKSKVGITLSDETLNNLDVITEKLGLTKSTAIALAINTYFVDKINDVTND